MLMRSHQQKKQKIALMLEHQQTNIILILLIVLAFVKCFYALHQKLRRETNECTWIKIEN